MSGPEGFEQMSAQPADQLYPGVTASGPSGDNNDSTMMDCTSDGDAKTGAHGTWNSPYDESFDEDDEDDDDELSENTSLPSSPYNPNGFSTSGDDQILEEQLVNDIIDGVDTIDVEQSGHMENGYEVHYIGLYKFVYLMSKTTTEDLPEHAIQEPSNTEDSNSAPS